MSISPLINIRGKVNRNTVIGLLPQYLTSLRRSTEKTSGQYIDALVQDSPESLHAKIKSRELIQLYKSASGKIATAQWLYPNISTNGQFVLEKALQFKRFSVLGSKEIESYIHELHKAIDLGLSNDLLEKAHLELAQIQMTLQNNNAAISHIDQALSLNPRSFHYWFLRAGTNTKLNNLETALRDYDQALSFWPDDHLVICERGKIKLKLRRSQEAIEDFNLAINNCDESALLLRGIAKSLPEVDDILGAINDLEKFVQHVKANPNNFRFGASPAYLQLGRIYHSMGAYSKAESCYLEVLGTREEPYIKAVLADKTKVQAVIALAAIEASQSSLNTGGKTSTIKALREAFSIMRTTNDALGNLERALTPNQRDKLQSVLSDFEIMGHGTQEFNDLVINVILLNGYI